MVENPNDYFLLWFLFCYIILGIVEWGFFYLLLCEKKEKNNYELKIGDVVVRDEVRGQVRNFYTDAPYVAIITFPQDVGGNEGRHYEDWPIKEIEKV